MPVAVFIGFRWFPDGDNTQIHLQQRDPFLVMPIGREQKRNWIRIGPIRNDLSSDSHVFRLFIKSHASHIRRGYSKRKIILGAPKWLLHTLLWLLSPLSRAFFSPGGRTTKNDCVHHTCNFVNFICHLLLSCRIRYTHTPLHTFRHLLLGTRGTLKRALYISSEGERAHYPRSNPWRMAR